MITVLGELAAATVMRPQWVTAPGDLGPAVTTACAGAWRAIEILLAGDALRPRLGKTADPRVRAGVDAILTTFGADLGPRADALAALREARAAGRIDGAVDVGALIRRPRDPDAATAVKHAIPALRRALADRPALAAVFAGDAAVKLLIDSARAVFRQIAHGELARWAVVPTGKARRDRALTALAELAVVETSVDELDRLLTLPIAFDDNVQFTVYRPRAIDPGIWHPLVAFAHLAERRPGETGAPDPIEEVRRQAEAVLGARAPGYQPVTQDSRSAVPADGELTFAPELPGIEINPPRRSFLWLEPVHREEFRLRAGPALDGTTVRGRMTVFLGHLAIAELSLSVRVDAGKPEPAQEAAVTRAYRRIFASYSHRDVAIVNQLEQYARTLGDEYIRDWIHLRTGEVWNDRLCQLIEQADAFQLFWSTNSMGSAFVRQEWEHALSLGRPSFVRPTYWEEPMPTAPGLPPEALLRLHFQKLGGAIVQTSAAPPPVVVPARDALAREDSMAPPAAPMRPAAAADPKVALGRQSTESPEEDVVAIADRAKAKQRSGLSTAEPKVDRLRKLALAETSAEDIADASVDRVVEASLDLERPALPRKRQASAGPTPAPSPAPSPGPRAVSSSSAPITSTPRPAPAPRQEPIPSAPRGPDLESAPPAAAAVPRGPDPAPAAPPTPAPAPAKPYRLAESDTQVESKEATPARPAPHAPPPAMQLPNKTALAPPEPPPPPKPPAEERGDAAFSPAPAIGSPASKPSAPSARARATSSRAIATVILVIAAVVALIVYLAR